MRALGGVSMVWDPREMGDLQGEQWELVRSRFLGTLSKRLT